MSNIVFKGDSVINFGEYLPAPYIERIVVTNPDDLLNFEIQFSVFFLAEDEPDFDNIETILNNTRFFYRLGIQKEDKPLSKTEVIGPASLRSDETGFEYEITPDFERDENEYYDDQDRRLIVYNATTPYLQVPASTSGTSLLYSTEGEALNSLNRNIYLYMYSRLDADLSGPIEKRLLSISDIAYEKIMSEGLIIKKDEKVVYFDQRGTKYRQVPLLALNRSFYKTQTVGRKQIADSILKLTKRFKGGSAAGLSDAVTSIEYVLSTEYETENLLVELDKVRRAFPNKTNNNPVGNLYAAFGILLQNINSAFLPSERLVKDKYLTGKVSDQRTPISFNDVNDSRETSRPYSHYISMPLVDRKIRYEDDFTGLITTGMANNTALYLLDYENIVREKAEIFRFFNVDKFFEVCPEDKLSAYKAALFSKFKIKDISIRVFTHGDDDSVKPQIPGPKPDGSNDNFRMMRFRYQVTSDSISNPTFQDVNNLLDISTEKINGGTSTGTTGAPASFVGATIMNYNLLDSGRQAFVIKYQYNDNMVFDSFSIDSDDVYKSTGQRHVMYTGWEDYTLNTIYDYIKEFQTSFVNLSEYLLQADEVCSYNNITNNFNTFFANSVKKYWEGQEYTYPWELAPTIYSIFAYLRTDMFESLEQARIYANEVMYSISPETGNLTQLQQFVDNMSDFRLNVIAPLTSDIGDITGLDARIGSSPMSSATPNNYQSDTQMYLSQAIDESAYAAQSTTEGDE